MGIASCAGGPLVAEPAPAPRVDVPGWAQEACRVTANPVTSLADLEARDRARGADVAECDAKRQVAVQVHAVEHTLEDQAIKARSRRNSWTCRTLGWFCGG